jgi:hypothetical protein
VLNHHTAAGSAGIAAIDDLVNALVAR